MTTSSVDNSTDLERFVDVRESYIEHFRVYGEYKKDQMVSAMEELKRLVANDNGKNSAHLRFELATMQRLTNDFDSAIENYTHAAVRAEELENSALAFDSWLGAARSYAYGTNNHGAAAEAFGRAVTAAGDEPTEKQRYEMADYSSQLQAGRGELDAALVNGLEAVRLAGSDLECFYAYLDVGDTLQKFAQSCDYRPLVDAKTAHEEGDGWDACRRAVGAAEEYYVKARSMAEHLGWKYLARAVEESVGRLGARLSLIDGRASTEQFNQTRVFSIQDVDKVLVNEDFSAGASSLEEFAPMFNEMIESVVAGSGEPDPRGLYLLGIKADVNGDSEEALAYFQQAVDDLKRERMSYFDPRQRGTVVENRSELVRDLALRLLSLGHHEEAFSAFEIIRARGLTKLSEVYETGVGPSQRQWLAEIVNIESQQSAILSELVETTIAGIKHSKVDEKLAELDYIALQRQELLNKKEYQKIATRVQSTKTSMVTFSES